jgi:DNA-binding transcriptional ArsR family regulator
MLVTTYYSAIGDEVTYRIGLLLTRYALSVNEISAALKLTQPHVSHKLARLRKLGCASCRRDGKRVIYRFTEPCRSILLHGDINWRKFNPEYASQWKGDLETLQKLLGDEINERTIYPVITGPPVVPVPSEP